MRAVAQDGAVVEGHGAQVARAADVDLDVVGVEAGDEGQGAVEQDAGRHEDGEERHGRPRDVRARCERGAGQEPRRQRRRQEAGSGHDHREGRDLHEEGDAGRGQKAREERRVGGHADREREGEDGQGHRGQQQARARSEAEAARRREVDVCDPDLGPRHVLVRHPDHRQRPQRERGLETSPRVG